MKNYQERKYSIMIQCLGFPICEMDTMIFQHLLFLTIAFHLDIWLFRAVTVCALGACCTGT